MKKLFFDKSADLTIIKDAVRNKINIINIILRICRTINSFPLYNDNFTEKTLFYIHINKLSRVFIFKDSSIHSLHFPFTIKIQEKKATIYFEGQIVEIEQLIFLLNIFENENFKYKSTIDIYNLVLDTACNQPDFENIDLDYINNIIMYLLLFEDGYIRYDYDNSSRQNIKTHPKNHLDIFYNNATTFKLGLENPLNHDLFVDILSKHTPCKFLK